MNDKIKYDSNAMQTMRYFEKITSARLRDTFEVDGLQVFVVQPSQIGKAVGKQGANVKKLAQALKKNIKIIEYSPDLKVFIKNTTFPLIPEKITVDDEEKIATIIPKDILSRGLLIGRQAIKLRETEKIVKRYFDLSELRVGKPSELTSDLQTVVEEDEKKHDKQVGEIDDKLEEIETSAEKKKGIALKSEKKKDSKPSQNAEDTDGFYDEGDEPKQEGKAIDPEELVEESKIEEESEEPAAEESVDEIAAKEEETLEEAEDDESASAMSDAAEAEDEKEDKLRKQQSEEEKE